ncbi:glycosyl hydrolase family 18 protein [Clostridium paraputrificum]|uniref:glycosyl hydrolase family 18 protein n=1 Tax=Clostridium paraputrificum TaxID=29363 RepID=UPI003D34182B
MKSLRKGLISLIAMVTVGATLIPVSLVNAKGIEEKSVQATSGSMTETVERKVVAYFPEWAYNKPANDNYTADRMPWDKMTHINYAFAHIDKDNKIAIGDKVAALEAELPGQTKDFPYKGHFNVLNSYKKKYPNVKTMISIGGWAESSGFYTMCQTAAGRQTFADSVVKFLRDYGFDGADIDYEYPTSVGEAGNPIDFPVAEPIRARLYNDYLEMMKVLRKTIDEASDKDGKKYLLTAAVTASGWVLGGMGRGEYVDYLDFINLMSYDYHGAWDGYVAHNSPLYSDNRDPATKPLGYDYLSTDWSVRYFSGICDPSKIVVGVPYYTRGWEKVTPSSYPGGLYGSAWQGKIDESEGWGATGIDNVWHDKLPDGSEEPGGSNPLWHVKNLLADKALGYERFWDDVSKVPYVWNEKKKVWLSFEDEQSMGEKMDYIVNKNLGGVMIWEIDGDYTKDSTGKYVIGDDLTTIAKNKLDAAGPLKVEHKENTLPLMDFDVQFTENFDHPNNEYTISLINNTGKTITNDWVFEFDLPNCVNFRTEPWANGATVKREVRGDFIHFTITGGMWSNLATGKNDLIMGTMTLRPSKGPQNLKLNGYASKAEVERNKVVVNLKAPLVSASTVDSRDGNYSVIVDVPANSKGNVVKLYEGNTLVKTVSIDNTAKRITHDVKGKANGDYNYRAVITDGQYEIESNSISVYVGPKIDVRAPGVNTSTAGSTTGSYKVTVDVPSNSNGTSLDVYENDVKIKTETITNAAKTFTYDITGKKNGIYKYKAVINKGAIAATSNIASVKVSIVEVYSNYSNSTIYKKGDIVIFNGKKYQCTYDGISNMAPNVWTQFWTDLGKVEEPGPPSDLLDLAIVAEKYNLQKGEYGFNEEYDLNKDNIIDIYDIVAISRKL